MSIKAVTLIIFLAVCPHANLAGSYGPQGMPGPPGYNLCGTGQQGYGQPGQNIKGQPGEPDDTYELYSSKTVGMWGDWGPKEYCPWNSYAVGFSLKSQRNQGARDDTALNGIRLDCGAGGHIKSATQKWGRWTETNVCYGSKNPIVGFDIKIERSRYDHTAANQVDMYCKDGKMLGGHSKTSWGTWSPVLKCPTGMAVVGIQTRVEADQGRGDDTALNGVKLLCRKFYPEKFYNMFNS